MKIFDYIVLVVLIGTLMALSSCTIDDYYVDDVPTLELDGRLPMDSNGYYHLTLNPYSNQTIHRITGRVLNTLEPTKVSWESNLFWWFLTGDTVVGITKTYINYFTGELTYVNLPPLTNWQDVLVPTINGSSYVSDDGEINTVIAPIFGMRNDTLRVECKVNEWNIIQTINIVLD